MEENERMNENTSDKRQFFLRRKPFFSEEVLVYSTKERIRISQQMPLCLQGLPVTPVNTA